MDALAVIPWSGLGWGGLIFAAVLALIRGELVPRRTGTTPTTRATTQPSTT